MNSRRNKNFPVSLKDLRSDMQNTMHKYIISSSGGVHSWGSVVAFHIQCKIVNLSSFVISDLITLPTHLTYLTQSFAENVHIMTWQPIYHKDYKNVWEDYKTIFCICFIDAYQDILQNQVDWQLCGLGIKSSINLHFIQLTEIFRRKFLQLY